MVQDLFWRWPAPGGLTTGLVIEALVAEEGDSSAIVVLILLTAGDARAAWLPIATTVLEDGCLITNGIHRAVFGIVHADSVSAETWPCFEVRDVREGSARVTAALAAQWLARLIAAVLMQIATKIFTLHHTMMAILC